MAKGVAQNENRYQLYAAVCSSIWCAAAAMTREWVVDSVPLQLLALTQRGELAARYFVRYVGFSDSAGGWEPRSSLNAG